MGQCNCLFGMMRGEKPLGRATCRVRRPVARSRPRQGLSRPERLANELTRFQVGKVGNPATVKARQLSPPPT